MALDKQVINDIKYVFKDDDSAVEFVQRSLEEITAEYVGTFNTRSVQEKLRGQIMNLMQDVRNRYNYKIMPDHLRIDEKDGIITIDMSECFTNIFMYETYKRVLDENEVLRNRVDELMEYQWKYEELQK